MEHLRVRLKLGEHQFEAEGPPADVDAQFAAFRALVWPPPLPPPAAEAPAQPLPVASAPADLTRADLTRLLRLEGRIVSLITAPASVEGGVLLALLGQKLLRNNERVMGGEIIEGIRRSGRLVERVDYHNHKLVRTGDVVAMGSGRAARYRLTKQGEDKAQALARRTLATL